MIIKTKYIYIHRKDEQIEMYQVSISPNQMILLSSLTMFTIIHTEPAEKMELVFQLSNPWGGGFRAAGANFPSELFKNILHKKF